MTPEMARIIDRLRDWHTRSTVAYSDEHTTLLGQAEAIVADLLALVDTEGADDGRPE